MSSELLVDLGKNGYIIRIEESLFENLSQRLWSLCATNRIFIITDHTVDKLYGDMVLYNLLKNGFVPRRYVLPAGEESKSLETARKIYDALIEFNMTRNDLIIALGGGVIGDLGGFVAATYMRGVPYVQVPTTLLAQVDSSVGGKVAVNLQQGKNMVGVFYQPLEVLIYPSVLSSLSDRVFWDGMAEVVKYACIKDENFLILLEGLSERGQIMARIDEIIYRCCDIKREMVERDEYDRGERMLLNFGHTLGHAVESLSRYAYSHGEGVAVGMHTIAELGESAGVTVGGTSQRIKNLLETYGLPYKLPELNAEEIKQAILRDKKKIDGALNLVLLNRPGKALIYRAGLNFFDKLSS